MEHTCEEDFLLKGGDGMTKKKDDKDFCCPEFVPPGAPDDFRIPENCCPPRLKTPKYPSPTSCLPPEQTRELEELIDRTNEYLLDLALSNERPEEGRMRAFDGLLGQYVEVVLEQDEGSNKEANEQQTATTANVGLAKAKVVQQKQKKKRYWTKKIVRLKKKKKRRGKKNGKSNVISSVSNKKRAKDKLKGYVHLSGRDFVLLRRNNGTTLIPLRRIELIKARNRFAEPSHEPQLLDIEPCFRRALTFHFGKTVASSPELIQLFFRLTIPVFLLTHLGNKVKIKIEDDEIQGTLKEVNKESVVISTRDETEKTIPIQSISFMTISEN